MSKTKELFDLCLSEDINVSLTRQRITGWSVEIYTGYKSSYKSLFYTDGHTSRKSAVKKALKFMKSYSEKEYRGHKVKPRKSIDDNSKDTKKRQVTYLQDYPCGL